MSGTNRRAWLQVLSLDGGGRSAVPGQGAELPLQAFERAGTDRELREADDGVSDRVKSQGVEEVKVVLGSGELGIGDRLPRDGPELVGEASGLVGKDQGVEGAVDDQEGRGIGIDIDVRRGRLGARPSGVPVVAVERDDTADLGTGESGGRGQVGAGGPAGDNDLVRIAAVVLGMGARPCQGGADVGELVTVAGRSQSIVGADADPARATR